MAGAAVGWIMEDGEHGKSIERRLPGWLAGSVVAYLGGSGSFNASASLAGKRVRSFLIRKVAGCLSE